MKNENYINIQGWMIHDLKLKGNELIMYAIIYGFSQDGVNKYRGSITYIQNALNISRNTAIGIVRKLLEKDFIIKEVNKTGNLYSAKIALGGCKNGTSGSAETEPNNNNNNNTNNNKTFKKELENLIESWNDISLPVDVQLPKTKKITDLLYGVFVRKRKEFEIEEIAEGVNKYCEDIIGRDQKNSYGNHRFTFLEFLKQGNGLEKFINL